MNTTIKLCILLVGVAAVCSAHEYEHHENHVPTPYKFEYGVHDPHTGDIKEAKESGDGHGGVKGYYKLKEADGTERIVHYTADKHLGFIAHVDKIGHAHHPASSHHESQDDTYAWAKAHQEPQHDSNSWDDKHDYQEVHYPHHYQPSSPEHKFDLHHDKHHGTSHQYVSLHH